MKLSNALDADEYEVRNVAAFTMLESDQAADAKLWKVLPDAGTLKVQSLLDDGTADDDLLLLTRAGDLSVFNNLDWGGVATGDGSGLTNLNGTAIASGTVADARLPLTIAGKTLVEATNVEAAQLDVVQDGGAILNVDPMLSGYSALNLKGSSPGGSSIGLGLHILGGDGAGYYDADHHIMRTADGTERGRFNASGLTMAAGMPVVSGFYFKGSVNLFSELPAAGTVGNGAQAYIYDSTLAYTSANLGSAAVGGGFNHTPVRVVNGAWVIG